MLSAELHHAPVAHPGLHFSPTLAGTSTTGGGGDTVTTGFTARAAVAGGVVSFAGTAAVVVVCTTGDGCGVVVVVESFTAGTLLGATVGFTSTGCEAGAVFDCVDGVVFDCAVFDCAVFDCSANAKYAAPENISSSMMIRIKAPSIFA